MCQLQSTELVSPKLVSVQDWLAEGLISYHIYSIKTLRKGNPSCKPIIHARANDDLFGILQKLPEAASTGVWTRLGHGRVYPDCFNFLTWCSWRTGQ
jgi:hypothetical protein